MEHRVARHRLDVPFAGALVPDVEEGQVRDAPPIGSGPVDMAGSLGSDRAHPMTET
jgi:hypothetical protein